jgi:hypothetical protein
MRGKTYLCAISVQPIFNKDSVNLEIAFLATKLSAEGNGLAIWLIYNVLKSLKSLNIDKIYVQSCNNSHTLHFYHRLGMFYSIKICHYIQIFVIFNYNFSLYSGFRDISHQGVSGLFFDWDGCQLMETSFISILSKLESHFNPYVPNDEDIIFICEKAGDCIPQSHTSQPIVKKEKGNFIDYFLTFSSAIYNHMTCCFYTVFLHENANTPFEDHLEESGTYTVCFYTFIPVHF